MRKYLKILHIGWLDAVEYRTEFFISIFGWGFRLIIAFFLWVAVAEVNNGTIGNYTTLHILNYFFIVQIISSFTFSRVGFDIAFDIYRGDFANFLLKPINYLSFRLIYEMSKNVFRTAIATVAFGSVLVFFLGGIPFAWWKIPFVILSIAGAYLVNFCLVSIVSLSAFWITNATRLMFIYFGILTIFSGMIFPIDLFPPKLFQIFQYLPFGYIFFYPAKIIQAAAYEPWFLRGLGIQWLLVVVIGAIMCLIFYRGVRRFESIGR